MTRGLTVQTYRQGGVYTVILSGELDLATAGEVETAIADFHANGQDKLVLDLSELEFMDSTGLKLILATWWRCQETERELGLIPGSPAVQRLFEISDLLNDLPFKHSER